MGIGLPETMTGQILSTGLGKDLPGAMIDSRDQGDLKVAVGVDRSLEVVETTEVLDETIPHLQGGLVENGDHSYGQFELVGSLKVLASTALAVRLVVFSLECIRFLHNVDTLR